MRQFSTNNNLSKSGSVHRNFSQGGSVMERIMATLEDRVVERAKPRFKKKVRDAYREKLIADQQKLINSWVKHAEGRKASLLADLKGRKFQWEGETFMIDWDKLISEIKQATSLEDAYQAFLIFHDVVDGSLALVGDYDGIRDAFKFAVSEEKMLGERRLKRERKKEIDDLCAGKNSYFYFQYWVRSGSIRDVEFTIPIRNSAEGNKVRKMFRDICAGAGIPRVRRSSALWKSIDSDIKG